MPPQVNADLRTVTAPAATDEFRPPSGTDTTIWTGRSGAWYEETRRRVSGISAGGAVLSDVLVERSLDIDPLPVLVEEGHQVTVDVQGIGTITGVVQAVERNYHPNVPDHLNTTRLTLEVA